MSVLMGTSPNTIGWSDRLQAINCPERGAMDYAEWEHAVSTSLKRDALWSVAVYRLALFLSDLGWADVNQLAQDRRTAALADQLYRALGSISANVAEGYSRSSPKERAHFYEYALGSARESRDWYFKARHILGNDVLNQRQETLNQIIRLLIRMISQQRPRSIR